MKVAAALLAAALALGPGCDNTFGTLTLIDAGIQSGTAVVESGPTAEKDQAERDTGPVGDQ